MVLGVTSLDRMRGFEDIPAISEIVPGFDAAPRMFIMAPAGIDQSSLERLRESMGAVMENEAFQEDLASRGLVPAYLDGPELAELLPGLVEAWSATAKAVIED